MTNSMKVSVVMCTFNGEKHIKEQLDSILAQTYPIYEIIVQDDCSTDNTWSIIQNYKSRFPIIRCFQNDKNMGAHDNFKNTFYLARGNYIAPSDQDDIWYPNKIEKLVNIIKDKMLAFSKSKVMYVDGTFGDYPFEFPKTVEQLIWREFLAGHTCMFHISLLNYLKKTIGKDIAYDSAIAQIAYTLNSYIYTTEYLQIWRRHNDAITKSVMNSNENQEIILLKGTGKFNRLIFTIRNLLLGNKSIGIENYFNEIADFQKSINGKKHIIEVCYLLAKQTLTSYLIATLICVKYRKQFFPNVETKKNRQKLAFIFFSFRYPFSIWNEMYLFELN